MKILFLLGRYDYLKIITDSMQFDRETCAHRTDALVHLSASPLRVPSSLLFGSPSSSSSLFASGKRNKRHGPAGIYPSSNYRLRYSSESVLSWTKVALLIEY